MDAALGPWAAQGNKFQVLHKRLAAGAIRPASILHKGWGTKKKVFPKSAPARFGCKQRRACNNTGVGYGVAVSTRSGGTPVCTVRAELARLSLSAARSGALLLKGPSSTERWFPRSN